MKLFSKIYAIVFLGFFVFCFTQQKTIQIKERTAIVIMPSEKKIKQLKKESASEDEFGVIVDDALYYLDQAKTFLKNKNIKVLQVDGAQNVFFLDNNNYKKLNIQNLSWDIIFYMPKKKPKQIDITDVEKEFQNYFLSIKKTI